MTIWRNIKRFFIPHICPLCGHRLMEDELNLCTDCRISLPMVPTCKEANEHFFLATHAIEKEKAMLYFDKDGIVSDLLHQMKYGHNAQLCRQMGEELCIYADRTAFFKDIDVLLPIPLHPARQKERGYNQSEELAKGIAGRASLPVCTDALIRIHNNATKTKTKLFSRREHNSFLFQATSQVENLRGKHIALIDDVLTTGTTLTEAINALNHIEDLRISVVTLARVRN